MKPFSDQNNPLGKRTITLTLPPDAIGELLATLLMDEGRNLRTDFWIAGFG